MVNTDFVDMHIVVKYVCTSGRFNKQIINDSNRINSKLKILTCTLRLCVTWKQYDVIYACALFPEKV